MARARDTSKGFSIGIAAERIGIHPQTLREYERKGLVMPHRTSGGARRYRDQELTVLRRIQELTEMGLSLTGVQHVLSLESRVRELTLRVSELERELGIPAQPAADKLPARRSTTMEIVHVPRPRRRPRWRNSDY